MKTILIKFISHESKVLALFPQSQTTEGRILAWADGIGWHAANKGLLLRPSVQGNIQPILDTLPTSWHPARVKVIGNKSGTRKIAGADRVTDNRPSFQRKLLTFSVN